MKTYYCNGGKGGVGKSVLVRLLIHYFMKQHENLIIVDGDTQQDIFNSCVDDEDNPKSGISEVKFINLREEAGNDWAELLDFIQSKKDKDGTIIVNSPAGEDDNMLNFGASLDDVKDLTIFFLFVNDYLSSENLYNQIETTKKPICVVLNKMFSNSSHISQFNKYKESVPFVTLGNCPQPYREHMHNNCLLYSEIEDPKKMPPIKKGMGSKWLRESLKVCEDAINSAKIVDASSLPNDDENEEEKKENNNVDKRKN